MGRRKKEELAENGSGGGEVEEPDLDIAAPFTIKEYIEQLKAKLADCRKEVAGAVDELKVIDKEIEELRAVLASLKAGRKGKRGRKPGRKPGRPAKE